MRRILFAAAIFASLVASVSSQPTSAGSTADTPKAQAPSANTILNTMSSYEFLLGEWHCETLTPQGKVDYNFTQEISKIMDGHWFKFHNVSSGRATVEAFATYDGKAWRWLSINSWGGYSIGSSPGWRGNAQTWTGYSYGESGARRPWGRIVFKKLSDREKRGDFYEPARNGRFQFASSDVCKKID